VSRKILAHVRNADIFALLTPLVVLTPVSPPFGLQPDRFGKMKLRGPRCWSPLSVSRPGHSRPITGFSPPLTQSPAAAIDLLKLRGAKHVLNDFSFGGYLISQHMPVV
jgi:hypothetical protein